MTEQRRFTKEFEKEALRLVATSGRTQRLVAEDLGIGLSTLVRWISRSHDRLAEMPDKAPQADMAAELKRLCRENEIGRNATYGSGRPLFRPGGKSMRLQLVDQAKKEFPYSAFAGVRRQPERLFHLEGSPGQPATT